MTRARQLHGEDGAELAHEVWLALEGDVESRSVGFLLGVLRNLIRARRRRELRRRTREGWWSQLTLHDVDPVAALERAELHVAIRAAMQRLEAAERELTLARYVAGATSQQLANDAACTASTVRWRLRNALQQVRTRLTATLEEPMSHTPALEALLRAVERGLAGLDDTWSGRVIVHLLPSAGHTQVERLEFMPAAPRMVSARARRELQATRLPGLPDTRAFEMHFDCSPSADA